MSRMIPKGMPKPSTTAANRMTAFRGLTWPRARGSSMSLPLSAVAASEIEFSSRFCNSSRYKPDFTSCWRPIWVSTRSCSGVLPIRPAYLANWRCKPWRWISTERRACNRAVRIEGCRSSSVAVKVCTCGACSLTVFSKRLRSCTAWLYEAMSAVEALSSIPTFEGIIL